MSLELLQLGMDFVGGLMGNSANRKQQKLYRQQLAQSEAQFNAQMDESVQRRVADAKAAGIHPLFAMGASVGSSPTISTGGPPPTGNAMGRAIENMAQTLGVIETNRASARRDEAEAALLDSERKRIEQDLVTRGHDSPSVRGDVKTFPYPHPDPGTVYGPAEYYNPQVATSQSRGIESGTHPEKIKVVGPDGRSYEIASPNLGLDEIAQVEYAYWKTRHWATDRIEDYLRFNRRLSAKAKAALKAIHRNVGGRPTR